MSTPATTQFATVEEALEEIAAGRMVVVVDDEDRENEGDLVMAAEFVSADDINFMATHAARLDLPRALAGALRRAGPRAHVAEERDGAPDAVHRHDRGARGRDHRDQRGRPRAHDPHRGRPGQGPGRHRRRRPRQPAQGPRRRRPGAHGAHRGLRRPRADGGAAAGRRDLRGDERGRVDGARRRPAGVLPQAPPEDDHDRRPHRLPPPPRPARRARRVDPAADGASATSTRSATARSSTTSTTSRWSRARSPARRTCSSACTRSA